MQKIIEAVYQTAKDKRHEAVGEALKMLIGHGAKFSVEDVTAIRDWRGTYAGQLGNLYWIAVSCKNWSLCVAYEKVQGWQPWYWPKTLTSGLSSSGKQRISRGGKIWCMKDGEFLLWNVTGIFADRMTLCISAHAEYGNPKYTCKKCGQQNYKLADEDTTKQRRMTLTRDEYEKLWKGWDQSRRAGILDVDGLFAWEVSAFDGRLSPREAAWQGTFVKGGQYRDCGSSVKGVVLLSEGIATHGKTLREARGFRTQRLAAMDVTIEGVVQYSFRELNLDAELQRSDYDEWFTEYTLSWRRDFERELPCLKKFKAVETFTARQVLRAVIANIPDDGYVLRDIARWLTHHSPQEKASREERQKQELADREQRRQELIDKHGKVRVSVKHAQAVGFCNVGLTAWLKSNFPDVLPESLRDGTGDVNDVWKIRKTLKISDIMTLPDREARLAMAAVQKAIIQP